MRFWRVRLPWPHVWDVRRARCWIGAHWCRGALPMGRSSFQLLSITGGASRNTLCLCFRKSPYTWGISPGAACWVCSQDTLRAGTRRPPSSRGAGGVHLQQSPRPSPLSWQSVPSWSSPVSVGVEHLACLFPIFLLMMTADASAPILGVRVYLGDGPVQVLRPSLSGTLFLFFVPWWTLCCILGIGINTPSPRTAWGLVLSFIRVHFSHGADTECRAP